MQNPPSQNRLTPLQTVLIAFTYFQKYPGQEVSIDQKSLTTVMIAANCPNETLATSLLDQMVYENLLTKDETGGIISYSRTAKGIEKTPRMPDGPPPPSVIQNN